jgi:hypothetical protein
VGIKKFRGCLDLVGGHLQRDLVFGTSGIELQHTPMYRDFAVADAHEAAEIYHRCLRLAGGIDKHINKAPNILSVLIRNTLPQDRLGGLRGDGLNGALRRRKRRDNRGRWRRNSGR